MIRMGSALLACIGVQACHTSFEPFQKPGRLSVFGALDASADTQWIRVTPIRQTVLTSPGPIAATVTLERVGTGRTVELRDSIVETQFETGVAQQGTWFTHNFWTTEPIEPGATYTLTVTGADRVTANSTVPIPADYSVVVGYSQYPGAPAYVRVEKVPYLGLVLGRIYFAPDCVAQKGTPPYVSTRSPIPPPASPGVYQVLDVYPFSTPLVEASYLCPVVERNIFVVASGSPWPEVLRNVPSALGALDAPSDIENGIGFLGGVLTKSIPWEPCYLESRSGPCLLTYDSTSVTLQGRVRDALTGVPVPGAEIHLTEIVPGSSQPTKLRGSTDSLGFFRFGAVEAGVSHVFRVSHSQTCSPMGGGPLLFLDHIDTLPAYAPAEQVTLDDVVLQRNLPICEGFVYPPASSPTTSLEERR